MKKILVDKNGHFRYYSPYGRGMKAPMFNLENNNDLDSYGVTYPFLNVYSEKQLAWFIFQNYGEGDYIVRAYLKGKRGSYTFWKGEVQNEGYRADRREVIDKEVERMRDQLAKTQDADEAESLKEDINFFKDMAKDEKGSTKYGFAPFLKSSGRRGEFVGWNEDDPAFAMQKALDEAKRGYNPEDWGEEVEE